MHTLLILFLILSFQSSTSSSKLPHSQRQPNQHPHPQQRMPPNRNPPKLASLTGILGMLINHTTTHLIPLIRNQHIRKLKDSRHGTHFAKYPLVANINNARGAENRPVCVKGGGTGKTGWIREGVRSFEAVTGENDLYLARAVQIAAFVAGELFSFCDCVSLCRQTCAKSCISREVPIKKGRLTNAHALTSVAPFQLAYTFVAPSLVCVMTSGFVVGSAFQSIRYAR